MDDELLMGVEIGTSYSRLYGGIHVETDDLRGRIMGAQCGKDAWVAVQRYWDGNART